MNRNDKDAVIADMAARLGRAKAVVLTDFNGLKVEQMTQLRADLKTKGLDYVVVKNTLLRRAVQGSSVEPLAGEFVGPNGVAISYDEPVEMAKTLTEFAKTNPKFQIKAGVLEGKLMTPEGVGQLAKLPGKPELLSMLLGTMNGVPRNFVSVLAAIPRSFLYALKAIAEQRGGGAAEAPDEAPAETPAEAPAETPAETPAEA